MTKINNSLQAELDWITDAQSSYDSPLHASSVKENIKKRYEINTLNERVASLEKEVKKLK